MKKLILALLSVAFSISLMAQQEKPNDSKESKSINEKIEQAIQLWRENPGSAFPDIEAIIKDEIALAVKDHREKPKVSEETIAINKKIDEAMQVWKQNPRSDNFPDIEAIIKNEISASINRKLGIAVE